MPEDLISEIFVFYKRFSQTLCFQILHVFSSLSVPFPILCPGAKYPFPQNRIFYNSVYSVLLYHYYHFETRSKRRFFQCFCFIATVHTRHSQYNRMYASRTFYCHEPRLRRSPLLRSSFLLIKWRSLRTFLQADFHASMKSACKKVRVNCNVLFILHCFSFMPFEFLC